MLSLGLPMKMEIKT